MKYKDMMWHWVGYSKMKPVDVDGFFKRETLNYETG